MTRSQIITHRNNAVKVADLKRSRILKEASKHYNTKQDEKHQIDISNHRNDDSNNIVRRCI